MDGRRVYLVPIHMDNSGLRLLFREIEREGRKKERGREKTTEREREMKRDDREQSCRC